MRSNARATLERSRRGYLPDMMAFHQDPPLHARGAERTDAMHRGVGALLVLLGSAMVYEGSAQARSPVGAGLGLLLVLTGSSLVLDPLAEAKQTA